MPLIVDFLLPKKPVSYQRKDAADRKAWNAYVFGRAMRAWSRPPLFNCKLKFTMVYISENPWPGDINNFVKPIQDALCALVYADDSMIRDVSAYLRHPDDLKLSNRLPQTLADAIGHRLTGVYVAMSDSPDFAEVLA